MGKQIPQIVKDIIKNENYTDLIHANKDDKALILLSGGLDSTVALFLAKAKQMTVYGLEFFYEGRPTVETERIERICELAKIDLFQMKYPEANLVRTNTKDLPNRFALRESNALYYSLSGNLAHKLGATHIIGGQILSDWQGKKSLNSQPEHYDTLNALLQGEYSCLAPRIVMPLLYLNKQQVVRVGRAVSAPLELTWSCPNSSVSPCSTCSQCIEREESLGESR